MPPFTTVATNTKHPPKIKPLQTSPNLNPHLNPAKTPSSNPLATNSSGNTF
jgi:hypothetical protein